MGPRKRFDIFFERHIGIGLRWDNLLYPLELSLALPFVTVTLGIGKARTQWRPETLESE